MLMRLIYASEATVTLPPADMNGLLRHARDSNAKRDLTGALMLNHRYFLQALEGEREVVSELYSRMARDPRHQRMVILAADTIDQRVFADWSMAFAAADAVRREIFLRHGVSSRFEPHAMTGAAALQMLVHMIATAHAAAPGAPHAAAGAAAGAAADAVAA